MLGVQVDRYDPEILGCITWLGLPGSLGEVQWLKLRRFQDPKGPGAQMSGLSVPRILQIMVLEPKSPKPSTRVSNTHDRWIFYRIHGSSLRAHNE